MLVALIEHSSEWLIARVSEPGVQHLLRSILLITGWSGTGGVDERVSEVRGCSSFRKPTNET